MWSSKDLVLVDTLEVGGLPFLVSLSVSVLANNALRAHHASAHGGVSTNGNGSY